MEYMNTHRKNVHNKTDHERIERVTQTLISVANINQVKENHIVTFSDNRNTHNIKYQVNSDDSEEESNSNMCDLCDKVLPNKT